MDQSVVIYKLNYVNQQPNYAWETRKKLGTRLHECKHAINRNSDKFQIWTHIVKNDHQCILSDGWVILHGIAKGTHLLREA